MSIKPTPDFRLDRWLLRMCFKFGRVPIISHIFFVLARQLAKKHGRRDGARNYPPPAR